MGFFSGPPFSGLQNFQGPLFASGPPLTSVCERSLRTIDIFEINVVNSDVWKKARTNQLIFFTVHLLFLVISKVTKIRKYVLWWYIFVFLVCSISTERYTGTIIEQDTQQAVPCDTYFKPESIDNNIMCACSTHDICTYATCMLYTCTMEMKLFLVPLFHCPWFIFKMQYFTKVSEKQKSNFLLLFNRINCYHWFLPEISHIVITSDLLSSQSYPQNTLWAITSICTMLSWMWPNSLMALVTQKMLALLYQNNIFIQMKYLVQDLFLYFEEIFVHHLVLLWLRSLVLSLLLVFIVTL